MERYLDLHNRWPHLLKDASSTNYFSIIISFLSKFKINFFILLLGAYLFLAFTIENNTVPIESDGDKIKVFNSSDCNQFGDLSESYADAISDDYSIYRDRIKLGNYKEAYPRRKRVYQEAPKTNGRIDYVFRDGIKIYADFYKSSKDTMLQQKYVDTMLMIYEKR
jgi:hypothetical protein